MIWGYPYFRKPPYTFFIIYWCSHLPRSDGPSYTKAYYCSKSPRASKSHGFLKLSGLISARWVIGASHICLGVFICLTCQEIGLALMVIYAWPWIAMSLGFDPGLVALKHDWQFILMFGGQIIYIDGCFMNSDMDPTFFFFGFRFFPFRVQVAFIVWHTHTHNFASSG